jgi:acyl carrier protein
VWCEVLELAEVGTDVNFADVGGHSLAMVQVLARLKDRVSHSLTLIDLFRYTTIRSLAAFLSSAPPADTTLQGSAQRAASRRAAVSRSRVRARS